MESRFSHQERLASLGILAAGVAHEINNPLAALQAGLETLKHWGTSNVALSRKSRTEFDEVLAMLEQAAHRCSETTAKLLLLSQPVQTSAGWMDLNQAIHDTLALLEHKARVSGIQVVEDFDPALPLVWARAGGIRSVCMNICLNAVQAMTGGGELVVATRRLVGGEVEITFTDTGPGIPAEIRRRIWDPFFTTKPPGLGTGLGLSVTNGIVKRHGGSIRLESQAGHGARFVVHLPIARDRAHA